MKRILALILAALLAFFMVACSNEGTGNEAPSETDAPNDDKTIAAQAGTFTYDVNSAGEYEIIGYEPKATTVVDLVLPAATADGVEIVGVGKEALKAENTIKSVTVPASYKYIGDGAFYGCDYLETVALGGSVTSIGINAFTECAKLASLSNTASIVSIGKYAFKGCTSLLAIDLSGETAVIEEGAFFKCSALASVKLSAKIQKITKTAFQECTALAYTVENGGKYLGNAENAYLVLVAPENYNITACTVNAATKIIADAALANCDYLETLVLGEAVSIISSACFEGSEQIEYTEYENVRYLGTVANPHMVAISAIYTVADTIKLHENVKLITVSAFDGCDALDDISFAGTKEGWAAVVKADGWNHGRSIAVFCTDGQVQ